MASTPYVLIARDVVHFSWLSQLKRQIRLVSEIPHVVMAGGSFRNLSGHWKMGCYQSTMKNYVLHYQEGYFHSRNECMLCDYLQGPFVAIKSVLNFDESLDGQVLFEDMFLSITGKGKSVLGCPDAMYFTRNIPAQKRGQWKLFAKKWILNRIHLTNGETHKFSCNEIGFKCTKEVTKSYLLPVCCQEEYANTMGVLKDFATQNNFSFELDTGSTLGTVKFNGLMPWDADGDVRMLSTKIHILNTSKARKYFEKYGIKLLGYEKPTFNTDNYDGYVTIQPAGLYIEVWGRKNLTCPQFLPNDLRTSYTLANVRGTWITTVFSPGLFVRNRYGKDVLKHSQSWGYRDGMKHSYNQYKAGVFSPCDNKQHHSCLQKFPADGNIPFLVP